MSRPRNERGMALTVTIIIIIILALLAAVSVNFGYNKKRVIDVNSSKRDILNNRAQAGLVDATTRIRLNATGGLTAGSFLVDAYDPAGYYLDVDGNGTSNANNICLTNCDTYVDIGPHVGGQRSILSKGCDDERPIAECAN